MKRNIILGFGLALTVCGLLLSSCKKGGSDDPEPETPANTTPNNNGGNTNNGTGGDSNDPNNNNNNTGGGTGTGDGGNTGTGTGDGGNTGTGTGDGGNTGTGTGDGGNTGTGTGTGEGGNTGTGTGEGGNTDTPGSDPSGNDKPVDKFYKVSYDANGGSDAPSPVDIKEGETVTLASGASMTRDKFEFKGWKGSDGNSYNAGDQVVVNGDLTFTAVWEEIYLLMFHGNGCNGTMPEAIRFDKGTPVIPSVSLARDGYEFVGWNTDRDSRSAEYVNGNSYTGVNDKDVTLYAIWKAKKFTYTFHRNLMNPSSTEKWEFTTRNVDNGSVKFDVPVLGLSGDEIFIGWKHDGSDVIYKQGEVFKELDNLEFYPVTAPKSSVQNMESWKVNKY